MSIKNIIRTSRITIMRNMLCVRFDEVAGIICLKSGQFESTFKCNFSSSGKV